MTWLTTPITTEQLVLRPMQRSDQQAIEALFRDAEVRRHLGGALSKRDARRRARVAADGATDRFRGHFSVVERSSDAVIGIVGFDQERGPWQLNYQLRPAWWGRGLAMEACTAALAWFWTEHPDVTSVIAVTQAANDRSCRLLERLRAHPSREFTQYEALQREYILHRPAPGDATA